MNRKNSPLTYLLILFALILIVVLFLQQRQENESGALPQITRRAMKVPSIDLVFNHPEGKDGEIYLGNVPRSVFSRMSYDTKRLGQTALSVCGIPVVQDESTKAPFILELSDDDKARTLAEVSIGSRLGVEKIYPVFVSIEEFTSKGHSVDARVVLQFERYMFYCTKSK